MGRRSINTTKSGKYMNPTDQARKEARKKELKKNKKQRQMVRAAVLKMKDPAQILDELEKIDDMEYNVLQPSPLNEKVLKEKRKKLRETLDRVLKMYDKDDPERWVDLKRQEMEYEKRRAQLISYYESVKHAQSVQVDDIPLPTLQVPDNIIYGNLPSQIPLPMDLNPLTVPMPPMIMKPPGILKKDSAFKEIPAGLDPPGVPIGPPPSLANIFEEDNAERVERPTKRAKTIRFSDQPDVEATEIVEKERNIAGEETIDSENAATAEDSNISDAPKPSSLQQRMLALSGQNIDSFMKEMEEVHRMKEKERSDDLSARLKTLDRSNANNDSDDSASDDELEEPTQRSTSKLPIGPPGTEGLLGISLPQMPTMMFRPPPLRMQGPPPLRMPPGPPPGRPQIPGAPPGPPPGLPPRMLRLPPGPPPGAPPRMMRPPGPPLMQIPAPVLSAGPQLIVRENLQGATIEAKPQIRNLSADVTRFVPSALRVKREDKKTKAGTKITNINSQKMPDSGGQKPGGAPTKDDAYMQFMQEMQGLL